LVKEKVEGPKEANVQIIKKKGNVNRNRSNIKGSNSYSSNITTKKNKHLIERKHSNNNNKNKNKIVNKNLRFIKDNHSSIMNDGSNPINNFLNNNNNIKNIKKNS
jgi:hypothetical protein